MKKVVRLTESDLVKIVKRVINEQLIGTLAGRTAFNLSKSAPETYAGRTPRVADDPTGPNTECYIKNIHNLINKCKKDESKYRPDNDAYYIAKQLYDAMNGISFGGAISTLKYLQKDGASKFCKVSNAFKYNNENLAQWIEDEISLPPDNVWEIIKKHANELHLVDECSKSKDYS